jgi:hypothetical protein
MKKLAKNQVNSVLTRLDRLAAAAQTNPGVFGLTPEKAKRLAFHLDKASDTLEAGYYGAASLARRRAEVIKQDGDEPFMENFDKPEEPIEVNSDEPYMDAFDDDETSSVSDVVGSDDNPFA